MNKAKKFQIPSMTKFEVVRFMVAIAISLVLAMLIIFTISEEPFLALQKLFLGPIESTRRFGNVIELMIPLTFTGLAVTVMFKAKQFNMAADGAFYIGGVVAAIVAIVVPLPVGVHPVVAILLASLGGGLVCVIPGIIKLKWEASELVSSLMLNFIVLNLGLYLINNVFRDVNAGSMASLPYQESALLGKILSGTRIHAGLFIVIFMTIAVHLFVKRTKWGYALRMTGQNQSFAKYAGIGTGGVIIYSQFIGGMIAGAGGAVEALGMFDRFKWQDLTNYGFDGIIVAILAKEEPKLIPVAAFFLAYLRVGADRMGSATDVTHEMVSILQGVIIMLVAAKSFMKTYRQRMIEKEAKVHE